MIDPELLQEFITEAREHLETVEDDILALERDGVNVDSEIVNHLFRSLHTIKGGSSFLDLEKITRLGHALENVVGKVRDRELVPNSNMSEALLRGTDKLCLLLEDVNSDEHEIDSEMALISAILEAGGNAEEKKEEPLTNSKIQDNHFNLSLYDTPTLRKNNYFVYECVIDLVVECVGKERSIEKLIDDINSVGLLVDSDPLLSSLSDSGLKDVGEKDCKFLIASVIDDPIMLLMGVDVEPKGLFAWAPDELPNRQADSTTEDDQVSVEESELQPISELANSGFVVSESDEVEEFAEDAEDNESGEQDDQEQKKSASSVISRLELAPKLKEKRTLEPKKQESVALSDMAEKPVSEKALSSRSIEKSQKHSSSAKDVGDQTVRIQLSLLDSLMNLASELVLVRNQNLLAAEERNMDKIITVSQRLNVVTSDLQAGIMQTRMRPVGAVFNKFTRIVRDLARKLEKEIELEIVGQDVELDKSIIEGIGDPLTHLVRNSVDHGVEHPANRKAAGKSPVGNIRLAAFHQSGQVCIQITDDGKGMDPAMLKRSAVEKGLLTEEQADAMSDREAFQLIFTPGFSTAKEITDVSGRGVGMDVVKSAFQQLGGTVDIDSAVGKGTTITVKLPLTLAIVPGLIVKVEDSIFAIPQINIDEVVWLYGDQVYQSIKMVDDEEVYWLRGKMLPILRLSKVMGIDKTYVDPKTGEQKVDRRAQMPDRRGDLAALRSERRNGPLDRRMGMGNSCYIVVLEVGNERYGLLVDEIVDTEEIVVKDLHEHLKKCGAFAGTTVLGDGSIAMILDIASVADIAKLRFAKMEKTKKSSHSTDGDRQAVILFDIGGKECFALPLCLITRVEEIHASDIQIANKREYLNFRGKLIPIIRIDEAVRNLDSSYPEKLYVVIPRCQRPIGILAANILDTIEVLCQVDSDTIHQSGIVGSQFINDKLTLFLDSFAVVEKIEPDWFNNDREECSEVKKVLLVEDSSFYQSLIMSYLRGIGAEVTIAENGKEALDLMLLESFDGVVSDIEMPVMNGLEFARAVRSDERYAGLPLLALSAAATEKVAPLARDAGFDNFKSKFDREGMLDTLSHLFASDDKNNNVRTI